MCKICFREKISRCCKNTAIMLAGHFWSHPVVTMFQARRLFRTVTHTSIVEPKRFYVVSVFVCRRETYFRYLAVSFQTVRDRKELVHFRRTETRVLYTHATFGSVGRLHNMLFGKCTLGEPGTYMKSLTISVKWSCRL